MKIFPLFIVLLAVYMSACTGKKPVEQETVAPVPPVLVKEILASSQNCNPDSVSCTYVRIEFPEFTDSTKLGLNVQIEQKIKTIVTGYFREDLVHGTLEHIAQEFIYDYEAFLVDFPTYKFGWYITANAEILNESPKFISVGIYSETFTGGAHPNSNTSYFVFDVKSKRELGIADIVSDTTGFKQMMEEELRKEKGLAKNQPLADAGFWLEDGNFQMPKNIGLTQDSVIVHFNPYEIAPYATGTTTLKINRKELEGILNSNFVN